MRNKHNLNLERCSDGVPISKMQGSREPLRPPFGITAMLLPPSTRNGQQSQRPTMLSSGFCWDMRRGCPGRGNFPLTLTITDYETNQPHSRDYQVWRRLFMS